MGKALSRKTPSEKVEGNCDTSYSVASRRNLGTSVSAGGLGERCKPP